MNHSPEPWVLFTEFGLINILDSKGKSVSFTNMPDSPVMANHRRIVACINACAGISSEELNAFGVVTDREVDDVPKGR